MTLEELEKRLNSLADRTLRYHYIIQLGRRLPPMPSELKTEENQVRGCMSPAWLAGGLEDGDPPVLRFVGDSESVIVKGLFAILAEVYNGHPPEEALAVDLSDVFERLRLGEALSPNRRNGFYSMVEKIRRVAASLA
ncbi:MAG: SufE family protein [Gemmatimonadetes bacterium]|nr:SufE family protein [Gemmatimonadota bacterium]MCY3613092.1 SufE family protein [Gemmatimonadota bacterium]MCY3678135.1 SufE family protein [Gemmatimonadota bacterium]MYA42695.1 SufE family protein [Gemmatimonadota bacterium]MYE94590.1 SufE family protein [Gemmatimonadota bacterium]